MIWVCVFCGDSSDRPHHLTGRNDDGRYLDPELVVALCHSDHMLCHDDWHTHGIADKKGAETFLESLELRLARLSAFLGRLAAALPEPWGALIALIALHLARWRAGLQRSIAALDRYSPEWRGAPGV